MSHNPKHGTKPDEQNESTTSQAPRQPQQSQQSQPDTESGPGSRSGRSSSTGPQASQHLQSGRSQSPRPSPLQEHQPRHQQGHEQTYRQRSPGPHGLGGRRHAPHHDRAGPPPHVRHTPITSHHSLPENQQTGPVGPVEPGYFDDQDNWHDPSLERHIDELERRREERQRHGYLPGHRQSVISSQDRGNRHGSALEQLHWSLGLMEEEMNHGHALRRQEKEQRQADTSGHARDGHQTGQGRSHRQDRDRSASPK